jgi:hypothetical protein
MRRRYRFFITVGAAATSVGLVLLLLFAGSASEGPLARVLHGVANVVGGAEGRVSKLLRGPGREQELLWLERYREDRNALGQPDTLLLGAYDDSIPASLDGVVNLEQALGTTLPLIHNYTAWGDKPEEAFPDRLLEAIHGLGSIPVLTWEPWLTDFENSLHPGLPLRQSRDLGGLATVARGDYDFYVDAWAKSAAAYGHTILLRFAHEMNDPYRYPWGPQNNPPQDFIAAWRHVVDRFRAAGADNVLFVWAPHLAYAGWEQYWPGDDYVDWVATGALNYGTVASWSSWWSFDQIFGKHYEAFSGLKKPIMIAEFGSIAVGGDRTRWFAEATGQMHAQYPAVKAVLFFNVHSDKTITYQALDWSIERDTAVARVIRGWTAAPTPGDTVPR